MVAETPEQWKARIGVGQRSNIVRRVGGDGTTHTRSLARDDGPGLAGTVTEHWNGRQDATAFAPTVAIKGRSLL